MTRADSYQTLESNSETDPNLERREKNWNIVGSVSTSLAMISSGLFASLLIRKALEKLIPSWLNYTFMLITFYTAYKGKREIVRFFNKQAFIELADVDWKKTILSYFDPRNYTLSGFINKNMTLNVAALFLFLSNVGFRDASELINDNAADVVKSNDFLIALLAFGGIQSFLANFLGFSGGVHIGGYHAVKSILTYPLIDPVKRAKQTEENRKIDAVFEPLKRRFKKLMTRKKQIPFAAIHMTTKEEKDLNEEIEDLTRQLRTLDFLFTQASYIENNPSLEKICSTVKNHNISANDFRKKLLIVYQEKPDTYKQYLATPETWLEFLKILAIKSVFTGAAILSMLNFKDIWWAVFQDYGWTSNVMKNLAYGLGIPAFMSLSLMAIAAAPPTAKHLTDAIYGRNNKLHILSNFQQYWMIANILFITTLGSAANGYQALKAKTTIAGSSMAALVFSMLGIVINEYAGFHALKTQELESAAIEKQPYLEIGTTVQSMFDEAKAAAPALPYRPWVKSAAAWFNSKMPACFQGSSEKTPLLLN